MSPYLKPVALTASLFSFLLVSFFLGTPAFAARYISVDPPSISPPTFAQGTVSRVTISARATSVYGISDITARIAKNARPPREVATISLSRVSGEQRSGELDVRSFSPGTYTITVTARNNRRGSDNSASSVRTFIITPPPPPPTLEFHIGDPKPALTTENGKTVESVEIDSGDEVRLSWSGSEGTKDCGLINRREQAALGKPWSYGQIRPGELVSAGGYGFAGKAGSLQVNPKTSAVEYSLRCWDSLNQYSDTKIVRITANQKPTVPKFKNFKSQTGPQVLDVAQSFTFDVSGDPSTGKPILDGTCASLGRVEEVGASAPNSFKRTYKVSITPARTTLTCMLRATSNYGPTNYSFSVVAYTRPTVQFLANNVQSDASLTLENGEKVKLSWTISSQNPGIYVSLKEGAAELLAGGTRDKTTVTGYKDVAPTKQTTYTLTATDSYGVTQTVSRTVFVATKIQKYGTIDSFPKRKVCTPIPASNKTNCSGYATGGAWGGAIAGVGYCAFSGVIPACLAAGGGVLSWLTGGACVLACGAGGAVGGAALVGGGCGLTQQTQSCTWVTDYPPGYRAIAAAPVLGQDNGGLTTQISSAISLTVQEGLAKVNFVDANTPIQELKILRPFVPLVTKGDLFKESMDEAIRYGKIKVNGDTVSIIGVNFQDIGAYGMGAFYERGYNAIFINLNPNPADRAMMMAFLPHEALHYFVAKKFKKNGYSGPDTPKLLAIAIKGIYERFPENDFPGYARGITKYVKGLDLNNQAKVLKFSEDISSRHDLTSVARNYTDAEWNALSKNGTDWTFVDNYHKEKNFSSFFDEYWARVYDGALGYTPAAVTSMLIQNNLPNNFELEEIFFNPRVDELELLRQIRLNGKALIY